MMPFFAGSGRIDMYGEGGQISGFEFPPAFCLFSLAPLLFTFWMKTYDLDERMGFMTYVIQIAAMNGWCFSFCPRPVPRRMSRSVLVQGRRVF